MLMWFLLAGSDYPFDWQPPHLRSYCSATLLLSQWDYLIVHNQHMGFCVHCIRVCVCCKKHPLRFTTTSHFIEDVCVLKRINIKQLLWLLTVVRSAFFLRLSTVLVFDEKLFLCRHHSINFPIIYHHHHQFHFSGCILLTNNMLAIEWEREEWMNRVRGLDRKIYYYCWPIKWSGLRVPGYSIIKTILDRKRYGFHFNSFHIEILFHYMNLCGGGFFDNGWNNKTWKKSTICIISQ